MKRRRIIATAVVVLAAALALAAPGATPGLYADPEVIAVTSINGSAGSGSVRFLNDSTSAITVSSLTRDASCSATDGTGINVIASLPFTVPGMGSSGAGLTCPTTAPVGSFGIRRCLFHANGSTATPLASFTGLCIYRGSGTLSTTTPTLDFGTVPATGATLTASVSSTTGIAGAYLSVADQDGNFDVSTPCMNEPHCHPTFAAPANTPVEIKVRCTPKVAGALQSTLHVVADDGQYVAIALLCNGSTSTTGALAVNPSMVAIAHPVNQGGSAGLVTISNTGGGPLEISSITKTGSPAWSMQVGSPCMTLPCTLPAMGSGAPISVTFQPTTIGAADGEITITSNDPMASTKVIPLDGLGTGTTLVLGTMLGTPPAIDFGSVPLGGSASTLIDLKNDPATDPLAVLASTTSSTFTVSPATVTIPASDSTQVAVTCAPTGSAGTTTGTVTFGGSATFGSPINIAVTCTATSGSLFAVPSAIMLGEVRVGTTRVTPIELRTSGPMLTLSGNPTLAMPSATASVSMPSSPTITSVAPSTFELRVRPLNDGSLDNAIAVSAGAEMIEIPITGQAVTPSIAVPTSLHLGTFCVDQPTRATVVELLADGTATIAMPNKPVLESAASPLSIAYTQPAESAYPYALPASQRAMVEIQPAQQSAPGMHENALVWETDMPGNPSPRTRLRVEYADRGPAISPRTADFGGVPRGQSSMTKSITLQNCGTEPVTLAAPRFIPDGEFRDVSPEPLPATLAPSQTATRAITFLPARTGPRTSRMEIMTSAGLLEVDLLGLGIGTGDDDVEKTSFYACGCRSHDPSGVLAIAFGIVVVLVPRRRRRTG